MVGFSVWLEHLITATQTKTTWGIATNDNKMGGNAPAQPN